MLFRQVGSCQIQNGPPYNLEQLSCSFSFVVHNWNCWWILLLKIYLYMCVWFVHKYVSSDLDCSLPGSSVHGIFQARILEWVAISFSRGSSPPKDQTLVSYISCNDRVSLYNWATWESPICTVCVCVCVYTWKVNFNQTDLDINPVC